MDIKPKKSVFFLRCPTCGKGRLFKHAPYNLPKVLDMNTHCEYCKEDFVVETGFYFGCHVYELYNHQRTMLADASHLLFIQSYTR